MRIPSRAFACSGSPWAMTCSSWPATAWRVAVSGVVGVSAAASRASATRYTLTGPISRGAPIASVDGIRMPAPPSVRVSPASPPDRHRRPPTATPSPSARRGLQRRVLPAAVGRVHVRARWDDLIDAVEHVRGQLDLARAELGLQLLHRARPDDRRGHRRVADHERDREVDERDTGLLGELGQRVGRVELALISREREVIAGGQTLRAGRGGRRLTLAPAARQPAAGERAPWDHTHAVALGGSQQIALHAPHKQRVWRLLAAGAPEAAIASGPLGLDDLRGRERRGAQVADLALMDEVRQRPERLLDVGVDLGAVHLVEVDPVRFQAGERALDLLDDPTPRVAAPVEIIAHRPVELGR